MNNIKDLLIKHEGVRLHPYKCTANKLTIGVGRNLEDKGITHSEALAMLDNDIAYFEQKLMKYSWSNNIDSVRRAVLLDMAFNLGISGLLKFNNMIGALNSKDYFRASREMLDSKWAKQVKNRALELAEMMATGEWPKE